LKLPALFALTLKQYLFIELSSLFELVQRAFFMLHWWSTESFQFLLLVPRLARLLLWRAAGRGLWNFN
jgi:hypothetical protein